MVIKSDILERGIIFNLLRKDVKNTLRWIFYMNINKMGDRVWKLLIKFCNDYIDIIYGKVSKKLVLEYIRWKREDNETKRNIILSEIVFLICSQHMTGLTKDANSTYVTFNKGKIEEGEWGKKLSIGKSFTNNMKIIMRGHKPAVRKCFISFFHAFSA